MALQACEADKEITHYNVVERFWLYVAFAHAEDLKVQERSVEKFSRWSVDLVAEAPPERRRISQFVGWSVLKAAIEHAEALLLFDRFPHRNIALQRPHRGGEPRYLNDPMRPLWSFTQPPNPDYFALLGALHRTAGGLDADRVSRDALAGLLRDAGMSPDDPGSPMQVFEIAGAATVPYPLVYRHLLLPEQAGTLEILLRTAPVYELMTAVKRLFLRNGESLGEDQLVWPPRSAKDSIAGAVDVTALNALVRGGGLAGTASGKTQQESEPRDEAGSVEPPATALPEPAGPLTLTVFNDSSELERLAAAVDGFANGHRLPDADRFHVQLCLEEIFMHIVEHGHDNGAAHGIEFRLEMDGENRSLSIGIVDDGRELDPESYMFQLGPDTIQEENVLDRLGLQMVRSCVDGLSYRRENGRNHLSLTKKIGN